MQMAIQKEKAKSPQRRRFLAAMSSGLTAGMVIGNLPNARGTPPGKAAKEETQGEPPAAGLRFVLPCRYYKRCAKEVLWTDPVPERALVGWQETPVTLASSNTAVLCMHTLNYGFPGGPAWSPDSPFRLWNRCVPSVPRMRRITTERIAPVVQAARRIGMPVIYMVGVSIAQRYAQHAEIARRAKVFPNVDVRSPYEGWRKEREEQSLDKGWDECAAKLGQVLDVAPPIKPTRNDLIAVTTAEASTLLRERGVWNILYTGFDTTGCVTNADGGMGPMGILGYRCFILRDCTTGGETAETAAEETITKATLQYMSMGYYLVDSAQLLAAIKPAPGS
jgi:nicotinamidase-related amidase